ncbi:MAG: glycosyltransferase family 4 protein [Proteobacteria bacterium]|nr:glycosyltransferase family 4 protein [Pseudomonadota bacterium]
MARRPIAYNLFRLVMGAIQSTPRGIDRIDFGYLSYLLDHWPEDVVGVMPTLIGMRCFSRDTIIPGLQRLRSLWREELPTTQDPAFHAFLARLNAPETPLPMPRPRRYIPDMEGWRRIRHVLLADGLQFGRPVSRMPQNAIYLDVGHFGLTVPGTFNWRKARPDIAPVFFVHDAIPLEIPQMVAPAAVRSYEKILAAVARHAHALITPTAAAGVSINALLTQRGKGALPVFANPLPIDDVFHAARAGQPLPLDQPYFVMCGAVEPRKNHALLLEVWRQILRQHGENAPYLVMAGGAGFRADEILAPLRSEPALKRRVVFAEGLASPALADLMAGARATLMPSFAEGFGLPPVEGLAMGVPAVLSDIPAHREAAGAFGRYLSPTQAGPWIDAVNTLLSSEEAARERMRVASFVPNRWTDHMRRASGFLETL